MGGIIRSRLGQSIPEGSISQKCFPSQAHRHWCVLSIHLHFPKRFILSFFSGQNAIIASDSTMIPGANQSGLALGTFSVTNQYSVPVHFALLSMFNGNEFKLCYVSEEKIGHDVNAIFTPHPTVKVWFQADVASGTIIVETSTESLEVITEKLGQRKSSTITEHGASSRNNVPSRLFPLTSIEMSPD